MEINCFRLSILEGTRKRNNIKHVFIDFLLKLWGCGGGEGAEVTNFMLPNAKSMAPKGPFLHV